MAKNIIICFDGTNNYPRDARQEREWLGMGNIEDNGITNILKLHSLFAGDLRNNGSTVDGQRSFYYSGVGTYGGKLQRLFNAGFSPANLDVATIMHNAREDLRNTYEDGDRLFIFGFSRGAAIARKFASRLSRHLPAAQSELEKGNSLIRFLGVFDTVASIGSPNLDDDSKPQSDVLFEDQTISLHVEEALHLVSLDDRRTAFMPTLMNQDTRIKEIWFPGAHSDVGGGFWHDGLSDLALRYMKLYIQREGIGLTTLDEENANFDELKGKDGDYEIDLSDLDIKPNHMGVNHQQDRWGPIAAMTLTTRDVRVNLDDVPLADEPVMVHESVRDRINDVIAYRPKALKGVPHHLVDDNGQPSTQRYNGLSDHI